MINFSEMRPVPDLQEQGPAPCSQDLKDEISSLKVETVKYSLDVRCQTGMLRCKLQQLSHPQFDAK